MSFRWDLAVLIGLLAIADSQNIWLPDFRRLSWPSSAVSNDGRWLYIDSGEISNGTDLASNLNILQSTYVFDLHQSWTNATVNPSITIPKPDHFPFAKAPYFWYSAEDQSLYSWAGSYFDTFTCQHLCPTWSFREDDPLGLFGFPVKPDFNVLWKLQTNDGSLQGGGTWVPAPDRLQPPSGYVPTSVGLWTSVDSTLWSFGGSFTEVPTWNGNSYDRSPWTTPGIVTFSPPGVAPIGGWTNTTESFHAVAGRAISAPSFGSSGAIVLLDSVLSVGSEGDALSTETAADMSQIRIYDIKSGLIFDQTATGDIPQPRRYFCAAGVSDSAGHFDMYVQIGERSWRWSRRS